MRNRGAGKRASQEQPNKPEETPNKRRNRKKERREGWGWEFILRKPGGIQSVSPAAHGSDNSWVKKTNPNYNHRVQAAKSNQNPRGPWFQRLCCERITLRTQVGKHSESHLDKGSFSTRIHREKNGGTAGWRRSPQQAWRCLITVSKTLAN